MKKSVQIKVENNLKERLRETHDFYAKIHKCDHPKEECVTEGLEFFKKNMNAGYVSSMCPAARTKFLTTRAIQNSRMRHIAEIVIDEK